MNWNCDCYNCMRRYDCEMCNDTSANLEAKIKHQIIRHNEIKYINKHVVNLISNSKKGKRK